MKILFAYILIALAVSKGMAETDIVMFPIQ